MKENQIELFVSNIKCIPTIHTSSSISMPIPCKLYIYASLGLPKESPLQFILKFKDKLIDFHSSNISYNKQPSQNLVKGEGTQPINK